MVHVQLLVCVYYMYFYSAMTLILCHGCWYAREGGRVCPFEQPYCNGSICMVYY